MFKCLIFFLKFSLDFITENSKTVLSLSHWLRTVVFSRGNGTHLPDCTFWIEPDELDTAYPSPEQKDHSDTANLPSAGPDWIYLGLQKGCLESRVVLRLDEALIAGVLWRTAGAPAKHDPFCQLPATSEIVHCRKTLSSGPPCHSNGDRLLPIPACMWDWVWLRSSRDASERREPQPSLHSSADSGYSREGGCRKSETAYKVLVHFPAAETGGQKGPQCHPVTAGMLLQQAKAQQQLA